MHDTYDKSRYQDIKINFLPTKACCIFRQEYYSLALQFTDWN